MIFLFVFGRAKARLARILISMERQYNEGARARQGHFNGKIRV